MVSQSPIIIGCAALGQHTSKSSRRKMKGGRVIPVSLEFLSLRENNSSVVPEYRLDLSLNGICIHVTESSSMKLLSDVLEMVRHAQ